MDIKISPLTPYNSFCTEPNGLYTASMVLNHTAWTPVSMFTEDDIQTVIEKLNELLQCFKGEHTIFISKLIRVAPFEYKPQYRSNKPPIIRDWEIVFLEKIELEVIEPKSVKVIAGSGSGEYDAKGWFLHAMFDIHGLNKHNFGIVCSSYKSAKECAEFIINSNEEIKHWSVDDTRKARKIKCNSCGKQIINTEAEQCSKCGRYFCEDCLTDDTCSDCGFED